MGQSCKHYESNFRPPVIRESEKRDIRTVATAFLSTTTLVLSSLFVVGSFNDFTLLFSYCGQPSDLETNFLTINRNWGVGRKKIGAGEADRGGLISKVDFGIFKIPRKQNILFLLHVVC